MDRFIVHTTGLGNNPKTVSIYDRLYKRNIYFHLCHNAQEYNEQRAWIDPHCEKLNRFAYLEAKGNLETLVEAKLFIEAMQLNCGGGYHPDTAIKDYVDANGEPSFPIGQVNVLQRLTDQAFTLFNEDGDEDAIYDYALELFTQSQTA